MGDQLVNESTSPKEQHTSSDTEQYVTFLLAGEEYGIEIMCVQGIQGWTSLTTIPNTPTHILGVINLRGQIVPIIDLRLRFSLEEVSFNENTVVIVVKLNNHGDEKLMSIVVVDGVSETYQFETDKIQPPSELNINVRSNFLKGLCTADEKLIILLDIDHLFDFESISALTENQVA